MNRLQKVIVLVDTSDSMKTNARDVRKALHLIDDTLKSYKNLSAFLKSNSSFLLLHFLN